MKKTLAVFFVLVLALGSSAVASFTQPEDGPAPAFYIAPQIGLVRYSPTVGLGMFYPFGGLSASVSTDLLLVTAHTPRVGTIVAAGLLLDISDDPEWYPFLGLGFALADQFRVLIAITTEGAWLPIFQMSLALW